MYFVKEESVSYHCCFAASVMKEGQDQPVCECFTSKEAHMICEALNYITY